MFSTWCRPFLTFTGRADTSRGVYMCHVCLSIYLCACPSAAFRWSSVPLHRSRSAALIDQQQVNENFIPIQPSRRQSVSVLWSLLFDPAPLRSRNGLLLLRRHIFVPLLRHCGAAAQSAAAPWDGVLSVQYTFSVCMYVCMYVCMLPLCSAKT